MIYYFLYELLYFHFKDKDWYLVKGLNVFQYVTFRTAYATITALLISLFFGGKLIEALKQWNVGQQIREEGPQGHQVKRGTPTMGGVLIVGSVLISTLLWARLSSVFVWTAIGATLLFGLIGFVDDYSKIAKQRSLGLTGRQKLLAQLLMAVRVWAVLFLSTKILGRQRLLLELQYSVYQSDCQTVRTEFYWSLPVFGVDCGRAAGIVERSEFD